MATAKLFANFLMMVEAKPGDGPPITQPAGQACSSGGAASPSAQAAPSSNAAIIVGAVLLVATVGVALAMYGYTSRAAGDRDPFIYAQIGKEILAGKRLYAETWIDKPPLGLLMYAAPQIVVPRSYLAIVVFVAMIIAAQAVMFAYAFRRSLAAAAACALFMIFYPLDDGTCIWPSTEHFANLFVTGNLLIALVMVSDRSLSVGRCLAAGALAAAAFHVRQNAILCGLMPALAVLLSGQPRKERLVALATMAGGGLGVCAFMLGLMAWIGDVEGYLYTVFVYPRAFANAGSTSEVVDLAKHFLTSPLARFMLVFAVLAADARHRLLVLAAVVVGLAGCALPMRNHPHYMANALPYVALLIGLGTRRISAAGRGLGWASVAVVAISLIPGAINRMYMTAAEPNHISLVQVAEAVDRLAPDGATLLVCGPLPSEAIQFASRLPAANRHCWTFQFQSPWKELLPKPWEEIRDEYLASPPAAIVIRGQGLREALAEPAPVPMDEYLQLVRLLLQRHRYRIMGVAEGYTILMRET
jgi:hypothetical protein